MKKAKKNTQEEIEQLKSMIKHQASEIKLFDAFSNALRLHSDRNAEMIITSRMSESGTAIIDISFKSDDVNKLEVCANDLVSAFKALEIIYFQRNKLDELVNFF